MGLYKNTNGVLTPIAGRGKAEYGASTIRTGTVAVSIGAESGLRFHVTFTEPMPDTDYMVNLESMSGYSMQIFAVDNKTVNGFDLVVANTSAQAFTYTVAYTAFKLYTDNEYNNLLKITRPDLWPVDTEIAFENGLYGMHKAGSVTLSANTQYNLTVVPQSAGLTTTAKFIDRGGWWQASPGGYKYFIDVNWGTSIQTCYWLDIRSSVSDTPCIRLAFQHSAAGTYAYDTWVTYTKS